jgi:hypothetical protein
MANPWDAPISAPLRAGVRNEEELFFSVGRALTKWEGLGAELGGIYAAFTTGPSERYAAPAIRAFGTVTNTTSRAEMIAHAGEAFFYLTPFHIMPNYEHIRVALESELRDTLKSYRGWAGRRNDIAHGYSTASQHPDYTDEKQPIITTYSLCPSHGHSRKWEMNMEPAYHYIPHEIDSFCLAFDNLALQVRIFAAKIDVWRASLKK